jgi:hypothetical protein
VLGHGPEVPPVHAALADEALVGLDDRLAEVLARAAEGVAEELDLGGLKRFLLFFSRSRG